MRRAVAAATFVLSLLAPAAFAQQGAIEAELDEGKGLYRDGQLESSIAALKGVIVKINDLRDLQNRSARLADAHFHLGLAYLAMRDESAAVESFRQVVAMEPGRKVDPDIFSPRVITVFERARSDVAEPPSRAPSGTPGAGSRPDSLGTLAATPDPLLRVLPGTKMVLERSNGGSVQGLLLGVSSGVVTLGGESWRADFPRDTVTRVHVVTGRKNHWIAGMLIGAAVGVVVGALETPGCGGNDGDCYTRAENIGYGGFGAGLIGGLIGALYRTDEWAEVTLERSARSQAPTAVATIGYSLRF